MKDAIPETSAAACDVSGGISTQSDQRLIKSTIAYIILASTLMPLWGLFDYLIDRQHFYLFFTLRIVFSLAGIGMMLLFMKYGSPKRYYRLLGLVIYIALICAILPMILLTPEKYPYYLGFSTIFFGTSIMMLWPLRYMVVPLLVTAILLAVFELPGASVQQATTAIFLIVTVSSGSCFISWLIYRNHKETEALLVQLNHLTLSDPLTGLYNRRYLDIHLVDIICRSSRDPVPLVVIMIDVDHFKKYNDNYGHQAGDECLRQIGACLRRTVIRKGDFAARYGGEEFAIILPNTNARGAERIAKRMINVLSEQKIPHAYSPTAKIVTVSIGIACYPSTSDLTTEQVIFNADAALYHAKEKGRNQFLIREF
jgi:diguanylate cyclase (GGDEF)-like protein